MNESKQIDALLGRKNAAGGEEDWEAKYKALKAEYDHDKPMIGRAKASDSRVKELEAEIARLKANGKAASIAANVSPEERGEMPEEFVAPAAAIASRAAETAVAGVNGEVEKLRAELAAERAEAQRRNANAFVARINERYPGFLVSIDEGGDKAKAWADFLVNNAASVNQAIANCDFNALAYHVDRFYKETLGVRPPAGGQGKAPVPDPATSQGGTPQVSADDPNKVYTQEEYDALEKKALAFRAAGDFKSYGQIKRELENILSERRLK